jgi:hypothetical protein
LAVVGVFLEGMHVRHLGQSQQRQQDKTQQRGSCESLWLRVPIIASLSQKSVQRKNSYLKDTQNWMQGADPGLQNGRKI